MGNKTSRGAAGALSFLEDKDVFVDFVDAENIGVAQGAQVVVVLAPVPDDDVVQGEACFFQLLGKIEVQGEKICLFADIHDHCNAVRPGGQHCIDLCKYCLQGLQKCCIVFDGAQILRAAAVVAGRFAVCGAPPVEDVPVGRRGDAEADCCRLQVLPQVAAVVLDDPGIICGFAVYFCQPLPGQLYICRGYFKAHRGQAAGIGRTEGAAAAHERIEHRPRPGQAEDLNQAVDQGARKHCRVFVVLFGFVFLQIVPDADRIAQPGFPVQSCLFIAGVFSFSHLLCFWKQARIALQL